MASPPFVSDNITYHVYNVTIGIVSGARTVKEMSGELVDRLCRPRGNQFCPAENILSPFWPKLLLLLSPFLLSTSYWAISYLSVLRHEGTSIASLV